MGGGWPAEGEVRLEPRAASGDECRRRVVSPVAAAAVLHCGLTLPSASHVERLGLYER